MLPISLDSITGQLIIEKFLKMKILTEIKATIDALKNGKPSPIDLRSLIATTVATFAIEESITTGEAVGINLEEWGITD